MSLKEWTTEACSECGRSTEVLFSFRNPYTKHWKFLDVYYLKCVGCDILYIGEYGEGKVSGRCWSRSKILRIHQLEGFVSEAYWKYGYDQPVEEPLEECI